MGFDMDDDELRATREMFFGKKKKKADEMLKKLGYIKDHEGVSILSFRKEDKILDITSYIDFIKEDKTVGYYYICNCCSTKKTMYLNMQELQAINKKVKELGWL